MRQVGRTGSAFWRRPWVLAVVALALAGVIAWHVHHRLARWRVDHWMPLIDRTALAWGVDPDLAASVVEIESGGDPRARSEAEAHGLMQVTPITLAEVRDRRKLVGAGDLEDPTYNLAVGCAYLAQLQERFAGDPSFMLAAYHMGPTRVAKWIAAHPGRAGDALLADSAATGPKTRAYVAGVLALWEDRRQERQGAK